MELLNEALGTTDIRYSVESKFQTELNLVKSVFPLCFVNSCFPPKLFVSINTNAYVIVSLALVLIKAVKRCVFLRTLFDVVYDVRQNI